MTYPATKNLLLHPAVKLLRKDTAALIISFLWATFRQGRRNHYGSQEITARLDDHLFALNDADESAYPRAARDYLDAWTTDGFLRQFYESGSDEVTFELTAAGEQALQWVDELNKPEFIGAESRLRQVFDMIRQLAESTTEDVDERRRQLQDRRAEIDAQLADLNRGELPGLDGTGIRERFRLIEENASRLRSDFRTIEDNFRRLNASAREELMDRHQSRGSALDSIFDSRERILDSDQGRTFAAFWEFLMDQQSRGELEGYLQRILTLPELAGEVQRSQLPRLETNLVAAADRVNRTTDRLVEQLRRFVQTHAYAEHQRLTDLIGEIEKLAMMVRTDPPSDRRFATIEGTAEVQFTMERRPFSPPKHLELKGTKPTIGDPDVVVATALYAQQYIDPAELRGRVDTLLRNRAQITLGEVVEAIPVEKGLAELIGYFNLATHRERTQQAVINAEREEAITYSTNKGSRTATFPETIFLHG